MKRYILLFTCFLFVQVAFAKSDTLTIYYDGSWSWCTKSYAVYYRIALKDSNNVWVVKDYFSDGNILQMSGSYSDRSFKNEVGVFTYYYPNGNKEKQGEYSNHKQIGEWTEWYENGNTKQKGGYTLDKSKELITDFSNKEQKDGKWTKWYKNGNIESEGVYKNDKEIDAWVYYCRGGAISSKGNYINGKKDGLWESWHCNKVQDSKGIYENGKMQGDWNWYFDNGQKRSSEKYLNDSLLSVAFWDSSGNSISTIGIKKTEIMPMYKGGDEALFRYLSKSIKYPYKAKDNGISGTVYLKFVIDEDGFVEEPEVLRSPHYLLSYEAMRVIMDMPKWTPGNSHNLPVKVFYNIPIKFTLR